MQYVYKLIVFLPLIVVFFFVPSLVNAYEECSHVEPFVPCSYGGYDFDSFVFGNPTTVGEGYNSNGIYFLFEHATTTESGGYFYVDAHVSYKILVANYVYDAELDLVPNGSMSLAESTGTALPLTINLGSFYHNTLNFFIESNLLLYDNQSIIYYPDCSSDSEINYTTCASEFLYTGFVLESNWTSLQDEYQIEFYVLDLDGNIVEPIQFYSGVFFGTSSVGEYTDTFDFPIQDATSSVQVKICINDRYSSALAYWGQDMTARCSNIFFGNGIATTTLSSFISGIPNTENDGVTSWYEIDCDEIGILDVKKGVQCGLLWAFKPSGESLEKFSATKNSMLTLYPIGYATIILSDIASTTSSTSTDYFDKDINLGTWFGVEGTATTTFSVQNLTSELSMVDKILEYFNVLMWLAFVAWLLVWGITRKL